LPRTQGFARLFKRGGMSFAPPRCEPSCQGCATVRQVCQRAIDAVGLVADDLLACALPGRGGFPTAFFLCKFLTLEQNENKM
jgi:hypothetical protein